MFDSRKKRIVPDLLADVQHREGRINVSRNVIANFVFDRFVDDAVQNRYLEDDGLNNIVFINQKFQKIEGVKSSLVFNASGSDGAMNTYIVSASSDADSVPNNVDNMSVQYSNFLSNISPFISKQVTVDGKSFVANYFFMYQPENFSSKILTRYNPRSLELLSAAPHIAELCVSSSIPFRRNEISGSRLSITIPTSDDGDIVKNYSSLFYEDRAQPSTQRLSLQSGISPANGKYFGIDDGRNADFSFSIADFDSSPTRRQYKVDSAAFTIFATGSAFSAFIPNAGYNLAARANYLPTGSAAPSTYEKAYASGSYDLIKDAKVWIGTFSASPANVGTETLAFAYNDTSHGTNAFVDQSVPAILPAAHNNMWRRSLDTAIDTHQHLSMGTRTQWDAISGASSGHISTFSCWVRPHSNQSPSDSATNSSDIQTIFSTQAGKYAIRIRSKSDISGKLEFHRSWSTTDLVVRTVESIVSIANASHADETSTATSRYETPGWIHIAITYDGTSASNIPIIYVNGRAASTTTVTAAAGTIQTVAIGGAGATVNETILGTDYGSNAATRYLKGLYADFGFWKRVLTVDEVHELYARPMSSYRSDQSLQKYVRLGTILTATGSATAIVPSYSVNDLSLKITSNTLGNKNHPAYTFIGGNDFVNVGTASQWSAIVGATSGTTKKVSISAWIYVTGNGTGNYPRIFDIGGDMFVYIVKDGTANNNKVGFYTKWSSSYGDWRTPAAVANLDNNWHHVVVTYDANNIANNPRMYINGVLITDNPDEIDEPLGTYVGFSSNTEAACIGNRHNGTRAFQGKIAEFAIWNSILTDSEIFTIYSATRLAYDNTVPTAANNITDLINADSDLNVSASVFNETDTFSYIKLEQKTSLVTVTSGLTQSIAIPSNAQKFSPVYFPDPVRRQQSCASFSNSQNSTTLFVDNPNLTTGKQLKLTDLTNTTVTFTFSESASSISGQDTSNVTVPIPASRLATLTVANLKSAIMASIASSAAGTLSNILTHSGDFEESLRLDIDKSYMRFTVKCPTITQANGKQIHLVDKLNNIYKLEVTNSASAATSDGHTAVRVAGAKTVSFTGNFTSSNIDPGDTLVISDGATTVTYTTATTSGGADASSNTQIGVGTSRASDVVVDEFVRKINASNLDVIALDVGASSAASVTITFSNTPTAGNAITIVALNADASTTTSATITAHASTTSATLFSVAGSSTSSAIALKSAIEQSTIASLVTVSAVSGAAITITQKAKGSAGNTTVTSNLANTTVGSASAASNGVFTGGDTAASLILQPKTRRTGDLSIRTISVTEHGDGQFGKTAGFCAVTDTDDVTLSATRVAAVLDGIIEDLPFSYIHGPESGASDDVSANAAFNTTLSGDTITVINHQPGAPASTPVEITPLGSTSFRKAFEIIVQSTGAETHASLEVSGTAYSEGFISAEFTSAEFPDPIYDIPETGQPLVANAYDGVSTVSANDYRIGDIVVRYDKNTNYLSFFDNLKSAISKPTLGGHVKTSTKTALSSWGTLSLQAGQQYGDSSITLSIGASSFPEFYKPGQAFYFTVGSVDYVYRTASGILKDQDVAVLTLDALNSTASGTSSSSPSEYGTLTKRQYIGAAVVGPTPKKVLHGTTLRDSKISLVLRTSEAFESAATAGGKRVRFVTGGEFGMGAFGSYNGGNAPRLRISDGTNYIDFAAVNYLDSKQLIVYIEAGTTISDLHGKTLTLRDSSNTLVTFTFSDATTSTSGTTIGIQGANDVKTLAARLKATVIAHPFNVDEYGSDETASFGANVRHYITFKSLASTQEHSTSASVSHLNFAYGIDVGGGNTNDNVVSHMVTRINANATMNVTATVVAGNTASDASLNIEGGTGATVTVTEDALNTNSGNFGEAAGNTLITNIPVAEGGPGTITFKSGSTDMTSKISNLGLSGFSGGFSSAAGMTQGSAGLKARGHKTIIVRVYNNEPVSGTDGVIFTMSGGGTSAKARYYLKADKTKFEFRLRPDGDVADSTYWNATIDRNAIGLPLDKWYTLVIAFSEAGFDYSDETNFMALYDSENHGAQVGHSTFSSVGSAPAGAQNAEDSLGSINPRLFIGYGSKTSGVATNFGTSPQQNADAASFYNNFNLAELSILDRKLSQDEASKIAESHLLLRTKSGFKSDLPKKFLERKFRELDIVGDSYSPFKDDLLSDQLASVDVAYPHMMPTGVTGSVVFTFSDMPVNDSAFSMRLPDGRDFQVVFDTTTTTADGFTLDNNTSVITDSSNIKAPVAAATRFGCGINSLSTQTAVVDQLQGLLNKIRKYSGIPVKVSRLSFNSIKIEYQAAGSASSEYNSSAKVVTFNNTFDTGNIPTSQVLQISNGTATSSYTTAAGSGDNLDHADSDKVGIGTDRAATLAVAELVAKINAVSSFGITAINNGGSSNKASMTLIPDFGKSLTITENPSSDNEFGKRADFCLIQPAPTSLCVVSSSPASNITVSDLRMSGLKSPDPRLVDFSSTPRDKKIVVGRKVAEDVKATIECSATGLQNFIEGSAVDQEYIENLLSDPTAERDINRQFVDVQNQPRSYKDNNTPLKPIISFVVQGIRYSARLDSKLTMASSNRYNVGTSDLTSSSDLATSLANSIADSVAKDNLPIEVSTNNAVITLTPNDPDASVSRVNFIGYGTSTQSPSSFLFDITGFNLMLNPDVSLAARESLFIREPSLTISKPFVDDDRMDIALSYFAAGSVLSGSASRFNAGTRNRVRIEIDINPSQKTTLGFTTGSADATSDGFAVANYNPMGYFNFADKKWESITKSTFSPKIETDRTAAAAGTTRNQAIIDAVAAFQDGAPIGFGGTYGFSIHRKDVLGLACAYISYVSGSAFSLTETHSNTLGSGASLLAASPASVTFGSSGNLTFADASAASDFASANPSGTLIEIKKDSTQHYVEIAMGTYAGGTSVVVPFTRSKHNAGISGGSLARADMESFKRIGTTGRGRQITAGHKLQLTSTDGTTKDYVFVDRDDFTTLSTGATVVDGAAVDRFGTSAVVTAKNGAVAVALTTTTSGVNNQSLLFQLKSAISVGHTDKINCTLPLDTQKSTWGSIVSLTASGSPSGFVVNSNLVVTFEIAFGRSYDAGTRLYFYVSPGTYRVYTLDSQVGPSAKVATLVPDLNYSTNVSAPVSTSDITDYGIVDPLKETPLKLEQVLPGAAGNQRIYNTIEPLRITGHAKVRYKLKYVGNPNSGQRICVVLDGTSDGYGNPGKSETQYRFFVSGTTGAISGRIVTVVVDSSSAKATYDNVMKAIIANNSGVEVSNTGSGNDGELVIDFYHDQVSIFPQVFLGNGSDDVVANATLTMEKTFTGAEAEDFAGKYTSFVGGIHTAENDRNRGTDFNDLHYAELPLRARPISSFGFPFSDTFKPSDGQRLNLSNYLDGPFMLEKFEIICSSSIRDEVQEGIARILPETSDDLPFSNYGNLNGVTYSNTDSSKSSSLISYMGLYDDRFRNIEAQRLYERFYPHTNRTQPFALLTNSYSNHGNRLTSFTKERLEKEGAYHRVGGNIYNRDDQFTGYLTSGDTSNATTNEGSAFWRCDTFFLMREKPCVDTTFSVPIPGAVKSTALDALTGPTGGRMYLQVFADGQSAFSGLVPETHPKTYEVYGHPYLIDYIAWPNPTAVLGHFFGSATDAHINIWLRTFTSDTNLPYLEITPHSPAFDPFIKNSIIKGRKYRIYSAGSGFPGSAELSNIYSSTPEAGDNTPASEAHAGVTYSNVFTALRTMNAVLKVTDGDGAHGMTAGQKITINSADGTVVDYFISDTGDGGRAHLATVTAGQTLKSNGSSPATTATLTSGATGIAVGFDFSSSPPTQHGVLTLLREAIVHSNGHNNKLVVSAVPSEASGIQRIYLSETNANTGSAAVSNITNLAVETTSANVKVREIPHKIRIYIVTSRGFDSFLDGPTVGAATTGADYAAWFGMLRRGILYDTATPVVINNDVNKRYSGEGLIFGIDAKNVYQQFAGAGPYYQPHIFELFLSIRQIIKFVQEYTNPIDNLPYISANSLTARLGGTTSDTLTVSIDNVSSLDFSSSDLQTEASITSNQDTNLSRYLYYTLDDRMRDFRGDQYQNTFAYEHSVSGGYGDPGLIRPFANATPVDATPSPHATSEFVYSGNTIDRPPSTDTAPGQEEYRSYIRAGGFNITSQSCSITNSTRELIAYSQVAYHGYAMMAYENSGKLGHYYFVNDPGHLYYRGTDHITASTGSNKQTMEHPHLGVFGSFETTGSNGLNLLENGLGRELNIKIDADPHDNPFVDVLYSSQGPRNTVTGLKFSIPKKVSSLNHSKKGSSGPFKGEDGTTDLVDNAGGSLAGITAPAGLQAIRFVSHATATSHANTYKGNYNLHSGLIAVKGSCKTTPKLAKYFPYRLAILDQYDNPSQATLPQFVNVSPTANFIGSYDFDGLGGTRAAKTVSGDAPSGQSFKLNQMSFYLDSFDQFDPTKDQYKSFFTEDISTGTNFEEENPYILEPEDDIVLGFQTAVPGFHSGFPSFVNLGGGQIPPQLDDMGNRQTVHSVGNRTRAIDTGKCIETTFGPHSQSKLVLYGSYIQNNVPRYPKRKTDYVNPGVVYSVIGDETYDQYELRLDSEFSGSMASEIISPTSFVRTNSSVSTITFGSRTNEVGGSPKALLTTGSVDRFMSIYKGDSSNISENHDLVFFDSLPVDISKYMPAHVPGKKIVPTKFLTSGSRQSDFSMSPVLLQVHTENGTYIDDNNLALFIGAPIRQRNTYFNDTLGSLYADTAESAPSATITQATTSITMGQLANIQLSVRGAVAAVSGGETQIEFRDHAADDGDFMIFNVTSIASSGGTRNVLNLEFVKGKENASISLHTNTRVIVRSKDHVDAATNLPISTFESQFVADWRHRFIFETYNFDEAGNRVNIFAEEDFDPADNRDLTKTEEFANFGLNTSDDKYNFAGKESGGTLKIFQSPTVKKQLTITNTNATAAFFDKSSNLNTDTLVSVMKATQGGDYSDVYHTFYDAGTQKIKITDLSGATLQPVYTDQIDQVNDSSFRQAAALLFGFGSGVNRNLMTVNTGSMSGHDGVGFPDNFTAAASDAYGGGNWNALPEQTRQTLEHPKGVKYGMMNYDHLRPKVVFRRNHFGYFCDLLEGRKLAVCTNVEGTFNNNNEISADNRTVTVETRFFDPARREITNNSALNLLFSQNLDRYQRSRVPFFDLPHPSRGGKGGRVRLNSEIIQEQISIFSPGDGDPFSEF